MRKQGRTRPLLGTVLVGTPIAVLLEVMAQALPPHYSALRQSESDLSKSNAIRRTATAKSYSVEIFGASHAVYVSRPTEVAAVIKQAAGS